MVINHLNMPVLFMNRRNKPMKGARAQFNLYLAPPLHFNESLPSTFLKWFLLFFVDSVYVVSTGHFQLRMAIWVWVPDIYRLPDPTGMGIRMVFTLG
jgi:hypothetical protein